MKTFIAALLALFMFSCSNYSVEQTTICEKAIPAFACKSYGNGDLTLAICPTEKECRDVCDKARTAR